MSDVNSVSENWEEVYNKINSEYKEAYFNIDKAIKLDEEGNQNEALPLYEYGLSIIDEAIRQTVSEPSKPDLSWEKLYTLVQKLKKSRKEIVSRIENIKSSSQPTTTELPPSYEDVVASLNSNSTGTSSNGNNIQLPGTSQKRDIYIPSSAVYDRELLANLPVNEGETSSSPVTYSSLSQQLQELKLAKDQEILFCCHNVKLYFIAPDGRVSSTSGSNTLIIARVHDVTSSILDETLFNIVSQISREMSETKKKKHRRHSLPRRRHHHKEKKHSLIEKKDEALDQTKRTFLQVGSWIYPLIPGVSPCVRSEYGAFILPDINSDVEGAAVGIILPEEASEEVHELFSSLLNEISATERPKRSVVTDSDSFSSKINRVATYLAHGLVRGAETTAKFIDTSAPKIIDRIPHTESQEINPKVQKAVQVAKTVSGKAVDVSDYLVTKISIATSALGRYLSPYIEKQGVRLLTSTTSLSSQEAVEKVKTVLGFTSNAAEGISTIYNGLDTAVNILAHSLANNTVQIIEYRYGQPAGALANDTLTTVGNVYYTHHNMRILKPKGIAKAAVKGALSENLRSSRSSSKPHDEFQGSGPGDASGFSSQT